MGKRKRKSTRVSSISWVSAGHTRNFMLRDPLLDWLQMYRSAKGSPIPEIIPADIKKRKITKKKNKSVLNLSSESAHQFILNQGNKFEQAVVEHLRSNYDSYDFRQIAYNVQDTVREAKAQETFQAMLDGVPFIYQAVLHDKQNCTFGSPDLLVRSDYLPELVNECPLTEEEYHTAAALLNDDEDQNEHIDYHYVVIDIKYSTLKLRSDAVHLCNGGNLQAYKAQLYIYERALAQLQGYTPKYSYLLGRGWEYQRNSQKNRGSGPFERLGAVEFSNEKFDLPIAKRAQQAVEWIRRLRKDGEKWSLYPKPSVEELYPNMSNRFDSPWHSKKKEIAERIGEITSVWYCGVKHRKRAHDEGVLEWTDKRCTSDLMGFKHRKKNDEKLRLGDVIDDILDINRQKTDKIRPANIWNNTQNWQNVDDINRPIEFFVDFETIHSATASTAESNIAGAATSVFGKSTVNMRKNKHSKQLVINGDMIFIIGCGWTETSYDIRGFGQPVWKYRSFVAESMTFTAERKMLSEFHKHIEKIAGQKLELRKKEEPQLWAKLKARLREIMKLFRRREATMDEVRDAQMRINLYHWGHIEPRTFERACERHPREKFAKDSLIRDNWMDFFKVMKNEPVVVRGALNFGLKNITNSMHRNGLINLEWESDGCANGIEAMAQAIQIYEQCAASGDYVAENEKMNSIVRYNEIDCKAVYYIIDYLRTYHPRDEKSEHRRINISDDSSEQSSNSSSG